MSVDPFGEGLDDDFEGTIDEENTHLTAACTAIEEFKRPSSIRVALLQLQKVADRIPSGEERDQEIRRLLDHASRLAMNDPSPYRLVNVENQPSQ